jgi:two-component system capsular synthesis response regulator RcsB
MNLDQTPQTEWLYPPCESACIDAPVSYRHRPDNTLRIILADDHPVVLMGAEMTLSLPSRPTNTIVATAQNADELIRYMECTPCDLLISDYSMPYGRFPDGLALMGYLKRHFAHIPLIVMTMLRNPSLLQALLNTGVRGLFDKRSPMSELKRAVQIVSNGRLYLCPTFAGILNAQALPSNSAAAPLVSLSERELEVVRLGDDAHTKIVFMLVSEVEGTFVFGLQKERAEDGKYQRHPSIATCKGLFRGKRRPFVAAPARNLKPDGVGTSIGWERAVPCGDRGFLICVKCCPGNQPRWIPGHHKMRNVRVLDHQRLCPAECGFAGSKLALFFI